MKTYTITPGQYKGVEVTIPAFCKIHEDIQLHADGLCPICWPKQPVRIIEIL